MMVWRISWRVMTRLLTVPAGRGFYEYYTALLFKSIDMSNNSFWGRPCWPISTGVGLGNATAPVFHQRHIRRVLQSSGNHPGRRAASSRRREPRPGRCPSVWTGNLRNDGGGVPAAGGGSVAGLDEALRPDDRCGKEVCRLEHVESGGLERGACARGPGEGRSAAQAPAG